LAWLRLRSIGGTFGGINHKEATTHTSFSATYVSILMDGGPTTLTPRNIQLRFESKRGRFDQHRGAKAGQHFLPAEIASLFCTSKQTSEWRKQAFAKPCFSHALRYDKVSHVISPCA
jgi:hypothetical protein